MKNIYYERDGAQHGPVTAEGLAQAGVTASTRIWLEGMPDWKPAGEVPEVSQYLPQAPPPLRPATLPPPLSVPVPPAEPPLVPRSPLGPPAAAVAKSPGNRAGLIIGLVALLVVVVSVGAFLVMGGSQRPPVDYSALESSALDSAAGESAAAPPRPKTPEEMRAELMAIELATPLNYLRADAKYWTNFIDETVSEGDIYNSATLATYKDVLLQLTFYSQTGTALGTHEQRIYDYVTPGGKAHFKIKVNAPRDTKRVGVEVIRAKSAY